MTSLLPSQQTNILERIVAAKRKRLESAKRLAPQAHVRDLAESVPPPLPFIEALRTKPGVAVIAEMKRSSPSSGQLDEDMVPEEQARAYCASGAAALSVLTEQDFFSGTVQDMAVAKGVSRPLGVPVLAKDFVFDDYQVYEARAFGADAVLIIIALLDRARYRGLLALSRELGMAALVEVFDERELDTALAESPRIVGVNNRDLRTLKTSLDVFERVRRRIPRGTVAVAESGMKSVDDVKRMAAAGAKAVLVGESLMRAGEGAGAVIKAMSKIATK